MAAVRVHLLVFFLMAVVTSRALSETFMATRYIQWMTQHGRVYANDSEKARRFQIFETNVAFIESFNSMNRSCKLGVNEFADLTNEEFRAAKSGYRTAQLRKSNVGSSFGYEGAVVVPQSIDWRQMGAVTPIKNQRQCGSCWAFSAVAAVEGITKLKTGKLISLSEQELVDCVSADQGCNGGLMDDAFRFIVSNGGLTTEDSYPYTATNGNCRKISSINAATINGYKDVPANNEGALLGAVAKQPVSVAIDASGYEFQFYSSGVFAGPCGVNLDHGVTVVGYGSAISGGDYWLVKNSWGTGWGENGYIRMKRGVATSGGLCGIAMSASYPTMA